VRDGCPIDSDVLFITETNEFPTGELRAVVCDDGVRYSKAMDDVEKEQNSLLGFDCGYWPSFNPFCELVYGDKQVGKASGRFFKWPNQVKPPDREGPRDGDHLESLGREVRLPSVVLTPFAGAYNLLGIGYCGGPIETLSECLPNQGSWCGMVSACPSVDVAQ